NEGGAMSVEVAVSWQPLPSVIISVYVVPGAAEPHKLIGFKVVGKFGAIDGDQLTPEVLLAVPPVTVAKIDPSQLVVQVGCVGTMVMVNAGGEVRARLAVCTQPRLSVTCKV
ncbi:MAG: hypothetical protein AAB834_00715, partial [Patescibacteria group bacterium]